MLLQAKLKEIKETIVLEVKSPKIFLKYLTDYLKKKLVFLKIQSSKDFENTVDYLPLHD